MMPMQNIYAQRFAQMPGGGMPPAGMPPAGGGVQVGPWNLPMRPQPQGTAMLSAPGFRGSMTPPGAPGMPGAPAMTAPGAAPQQPVMQGTAQNSLRARMGLM